MEDATEAQGGQPRTRAGETLRAELARLDLTLQQGAGQGGLEHARAVFRLTPFEREVVLLALAPEVDERYCDLLASAQGHPERRRPTLGFAARWLGACFGVDSAAASVALAQSGHLCRTGLLDVIGAGPRSSRELCLPEAFWPRLAGVPQPGPFEIAERGSDALAALALAAPTRVAAEDVVGWLRQRGAHQALVLIQGTEGSGRETFARAVASELGLRSLLVDAGQLEPLDQLRALVREAAWHVAAVIVRGPVRPELVGKLCAELSTLLFIVAPSGTQRELTASGPRPSIAVEIQPLDAPEREALWNRLLADRGHAPDATPRALGSRYRLGAGRLSAIARVARAASEARRDGLVTAADIQAACRNTDGSPGSLATRMEGSFDERDIVLSAATRRELALITAWVRHGPGVFRVGGSGAFLRGRSGLVALFAGPPGTGKTMAAQVLSHTLGLPMLRVDLSQVVNKYVGETEKNLARVFTDAEAEGALLFFDEADALFGKRTELRDAHDRYANLETAFLLQRLETHAGLVILATNLQSNLDVAFLRRIQVFAEFPLPEPLERQAIWERHLPQDRLDADVDLAGLASMFSLAGGDIRNAVIVAALLAAEEQALVSMRHLVIGVWRELRKSGRLVSPEDFGPWRSDVLRYVRDAACTSPVGDPR